MNIDAMNWAGRTEALHSQRMENLPQGEEKMTENEQALKQAARDFEAIFYHQLFRSMRSTVPESELIHGGMAEDVFEEMLDYELAQMATAEKEGGLAEMIYQQYRPLLPEED